MAAPVLLTVSNSDYLANFSSSTTIPDLASLRSPSLVRFEQILIRDAFGPQDPVPSADGRVILYTAFSDDPAGAGSGFEPTRQTIRRVDRVSGKISDVVAGATSFALSSDGRFAYARTVPPHGRDDSSVVRPVDVVVRDGLDGEDVVWSTTPAYFQIVAWAGKRLLVERGGDLLVVDGPGEAREIPDSSLLAVSPRGDQAIVLRYGSAPPTTLIRLDDLSEHPSPLPDGAIFADRVGWVGDRIAAKYSTPEGDVRVVVIDPEGNEPAAEFTAPLLISFLAGPWLTPDGGVAALVSDFQGPDPAMTMWRCREGAGCRTSASPVLRAPLDWAFSRASNPSRPSSLPVVQQ